MDPITLALVNIAPSLLRFFGAGDKPVAVAEQAIAIAKTVTGVDEADAALAILQDDPERAAAYRLAVLAAEGELEALFLADRQDARRRDIEMHRLGYSNRRADLMIAGDVVGLLACLSAMVYVTWLGVQGAAGGDVNPIIMALNGPLGMLTQQFANGLSDAHKFEFGSSRGSKEKDAPRWSPRP